MTQKIDVATWLMFLMEVLSDEEKQEEIVLRISQETGLSCQDVEEILHATYWVLTEDLPAH